MIYVLHTHVCATPGRNIITELNILDTMYFMQYIVFYSNHFNFRVITYQLAGQCLWTAVETVYGIVMS